ncbi:thioesterase II family protein [Streptomyces albogriseolus]|uniref:thioesterase II family protein n=1 Tax=Streptomyces albogriseolus TaxID=1887 RepID=UPI0034604E8C
MTVPIATDLWLRRYHPAPDSDVTLVCLPHAGGSAPYFRPLSALVSPVVDVLCVQYPGRLDRRNERPLVTITDLAEEVTAALRGLRDRRLVLFGHSMGACIAYEVARRLTSAPSSTLLGVIASGRCAPSRTRNNGVHLRDDDGVIGEIRALDGTDPALLADDDLIRMILPAVRSDYQAVETYTFQPGPPLPVPVSVLLGDADPQVTVAEAGDWRGFTARGFRSRVFPGGHFYLAALQAEVAAAVIDDVQWFRTTEALPEEI